MAKVEIEESELDGLYDDELMLLALEETGVDNWDGYSDAQDLFNKWDREE